MAQKATPERDLIWDSALEALSDSRFLSQFSRKSRAELSSVMRVCRPYVVHDLSQLFCLTALRQHQERKDYLAHLGEERLSAMLVMLGRAMKCWIETDAAALTKPGQTHGPHGRWTIAHC